MTRTNLGWLGVLATSLMTVACSGDGSSDGGAGAAGVDGKDGKDGAVGANGSDGKDGKNGTSGEDGKDGTAGVDGDPGAEGAEGPVGPPGPGTKWLSFAEVGFARTNLEKHQVRASASANVDGATVAIGYQTILRSNHDPAASGGTCNLTTSPQTCAGAQIAADGTIMKDDAAVPMVSNQNDFSSLLSVGGNKFLVHQFESYPSPIYVTKLSQNTTTGALTATSTKSVDLSGVDGVYRSCAGSITPWWTHITSEEAQVDARGVDAATTWAELTATSRWGEIKFMGQYLGLNMTDGVDADVYPDIPVGDFQTTYSAYFHGYAVETKLDESGVATVKKHYAMGRMGMELAYVMPDQKTAFMTDDVTNGALMMFVADTAGDLSSGELFASRFYQSSAPGTTINFDLEWISLGKASDADIKALLHPASGPRIKFSDIFETDTVVAGPPASCNAGFTLVRANGDNTNLECLKLKAGMEKAASRLESRRYAAMLGATAELTKEEGLTYDPDLNRLYIGLSDITSSMLGQTGGADHINVASNRCGVVVALDVGAWYSAAGTEVTSYAALNMYPLVAGQEVADYPATSAYYGNTCNVGGIASPDNVTYLPGYQMLMIGEDTGKHQNDAMWAYHVPSKKMTRMLTTPYGSEVTSPYWVPDFGGHGYLITAVQHPYGESDTARVADAESTGIDSWIGVVGPFPKLN